MEVQGQHDDRFEWRMWVYHYRVFDRYGEDVASLAVLADADPAWRPNAFRKSAWGCQLEFRFPIVKLADYRARLIELEESENPFALLVAAYLHAQGTKPASQQRLVSKLRLVRSLYERNMSRDQLVELFVCLDWFLSLSPSLDKSFKEEIIRIEGVKNVAHMSSIEKLGYKRGRKDGRDEARQEARQEVLIKILASRFGAALPAITDQVQAIKDTKVLDDLVDHALKDDSLEKFAERL